MSGPFPAFTTNGHSDAPSGPTTCPIAGDIMYTNEWPSGTIIQGNHGSAFNIVWADGHADSWKDTQKKVIGHTASTDWKFAGQGFEIAWREIEGK